ncbi:(p)ppGpp synthase/HD superfamily hydrolase [Catenulispora sp. MAP5-51]|uniref:HD domain-containing protein n=1 Tax=Catenulispora sp. MAP5-51 TaxID=3156298 RepID=UPI00351413F1
MDGIERGQLSVMPIHAVTEVYGEAGLRMLFEIESEAFPDQERATMLRAERVASRLHAGDKRVREPYVNHLLRVALRITRHYQVRDAEVIVAALLHDAVEDHPRDLADLAGDAERAAGERNAALTMLARAFTPRVANLIASVTNPDYDPGRDRGEQYREHVVESLEVDPWARVIKLSDFTDNGVGIIHTTGPKVRKASAKYAPLVPQLRDFALRDDTPLSAEVKAHIVGQLDLAAERFRAILG